MDSIRSRQEGDDVNNCTFHVFFDEDKKHVLTMFFDEDKKHVLTIHCKKERRDVDVKVAFGPNYKDIPNIPFDVLEYYDTIINKMQDKCNGQTPRGQIRTRAEYIRATIKKLKSFDASMKQAFFEKQKQVIDNIDQFLSQ